MGNFFNRLGQRFRQFMIGRYGSDNLSRFMIGLAFFFMLINLFLRNRTWVLSVLVWALLILVYLRMFSRNIQARYNENTRYLMLKEKVMNFFRGRRNSGSSQKNYGGFGNPYRDYAEAAQKPRNYMRSDKEHRIFRCPKCNQRVRVPRGRGMIEITCPRCGNTFRKRS